MNNNFKIKFYKRKYLINKGFQLKYTLYIALICSVIYAILGYFFYKAILDVTNLLEIKSIAVRGIIEKEDNFALYYLIGFFVIQISSLLVLGTLITHRIAGPIFRFRRILNNLSEGKIEKIGKLRDKDEFKEIMEPIDKISMLIYNNAKNDFETLCKIENDLVEMTNQRAAGPNLSNLTDNPIIFSKKEYLAGSGANKQVDINDKIKRIKENILKLKSEKKNILDNSKMD